MSNIPEYFTFDKFISKEQAMTDLEDEYDENDYKDRDEDEEENEMFVSDLISDDWTDSLYDLDKYIDIREEFDPIRDYGKAYGEEILEEIIKQIKKLYYGYTDENGNKVIGELEKYKNNKESYNLDEITVKINTTIHNVIKNIVTEEKLVYIGGYANSLYSRYLKNNERVKEIIKMY